MCDEKRIKRQGKAHEKAAQEIIFPARPFDNERLVSFSFAYIIVLKQYP